MSLLKGEVWEGRSKTEMSLCSLKQKHILWNLFMEVLYGECTHPGRYGKGTQSGATALQKIYQALAVTLRRQI